MILKSTEAGESNVSLPQIFHLSSGNIIKAYSIVAELSLLLLFSCVPVFLFLRQIARVNLESVGLLGSQGRKGRKGILDPWGHLESLGNRASV